MRKIPEFYPKKQGRPQGSRPLDLEGGRTSSEHNTAILRVLHDALEDSLQQAIEAHDEDLYYRDLMIKAILSVIFGADWTEVDFEEIDWQEIAASEIDHSELGGLTDDDHTQYIKHSLATAVSDFLVASGAGAFIKKTLAEVKTILGLGSAAYTAATDYVTHALATAANDFLVASGSGAYVKKTLAETLAILAHSIASHNDTTATGAELEELTDGSETTLHSHAAAGNGATIVRKTADKTLNNVAVLENDNHLLMAVGANEVWQIDIFLLIRAHSTTPDLKFGFSYPVDCLIDWGGIASGVGAGQNYTWGVCGATTSQYRKTQTGTLSVGTDNDFSMFKFSLIVTNGANAGNVNLQWCQNTAHESNTIVEDNSCLIAHKLA